MSIESISLLLVDLSTARRAVLSEAAAVAFGAHSVRTIAATGLVGAAKESGTGTEIVVLGEPSPEDVAQAWTAEDSNGLPRWAVVISGPVDAVPAGMEVLAEDDFEPRILARALRSSLAARELRRQFARERGDVWTIGRRLTHDLRNPLGCIVTTSEMLKESLATDAPAQIPLTEAVLESTGEMLDLINRVHFVAKASAQPKAPERFDMGAALQAAVDRLQREITRERAVLEVPEEWPEVRAVRPWVESIWADLLANAIRHSSSPVRIECGWQRDAEGWTFWVEDTGPGVPAERVPWLFTPFHRLHLRHGGGVGLSIVHRLVELQRGRCDYEAGAGGGARFSFTLPDAGDSTVQGVPAARRSERRSDSVGAPDGLAASPSPAG